MSPRRGLLAVPTMQHPAPGWDDIIYELGDNSVSFSGLGAGALEGTSTHLDAGASTAVAD